MQELLTTYEQQDITERQPVTFEHVEQIWTETVSPALKTFETVSDPQLKFGGLCEAYAKRPLHKLNHFLHTISRYLGVAAETMLVKGLHLWWVQTQGCSPSLYQTWIL